ncbi:putative DDE Tnp4 domain-containing protein [Phytophthora infestans]|uniref:Putative DDE Tnp4 domain-containing protein n=1 Tax=Phytophthora infestans TaxID=4787 RepID=A0A8S9UJP2_PHYIN|nr:putative DDE Tnp4 domain-containing protein [Phytophthora infestans]
MSGDSVAQLEDASDEDEGVVRVLALVAGYYGHTYFDKQPFHNSILTGSDWVAERIEGNPTRMFRSYRMNADRQTPWYRVSVEEKPAIFLYSIAKSASSCDLQECFQHSGETIHRSSTYLVQPVTPPQLLQNDPKKAGQFDQCRLAFDGTHIPAYVPSESTKPFRDRTGKICQNVLAACTFDMQFVYVLSGSVADSTVLADARRKGFKTPPGLGFAGYGLATKVMTPYLGVRYHLKELQKDLPDDPDDVLEEEASDNERQMPTTLREIPLEIIGERVIFVIY